MLQMSIEMEGNMLKLTLKPGEFINIGDDIRVVFSGGSSHNIHLLIDAPRELNVARSRAIQRNASEQEQSLMKTYYKEEGISKEAQKEIAAILMREKSKSR